MMEAVKRILGLKARPVMETLLRFQVRHPDVVEVIIEKEAETVRVRVVDVRSGEEAQRKEAKL